LKWTFTMAQKQSPGYPNFPLEKAIWMAGQIFDNDRKNPIDRAVAAEHIGYSGISGASEKALSTLTHFGLIEKAGKGQVRVTQTLVDILHPDEEEDKREALKTAGLSPAIFREIRSRFEDGMPSEGALKSWLAREDFLDRAINPVTKAFLATMQYLQHSGAFQSGEEQRGSNADSGNATEPTRGSQAIVSSLRRLDASGAEPGSELNKINAEIAGDVVRISALLDRDGLEKLEKKIAALKDFLNDD
jgi:hypothetical protein